MSTRRIIAFIVFYIGIILAILFTFFYVQERYGRKPDRQQSDAGAPYSICTQFSPAYDSTPDTAFHLL